MVTLSEVVKEVGKDVARFFFISSSFNNTLDFDLEVAKKESEENPVYYIQYAYARICSIFRKSEEIETNGEANLSLLSSPEEKNLIKKLIEFPELILNISNTYEVQKLTTYTKEIANYFHIFYHNCRVIDKENMELTKARLLFLKAVKIVLENLFKIIGIEKREVM
jgi:arginyl-tRNA synthetase